MPARVVAVGVLILVVAATVYAERMQISRGEPDLLGQRSIGLGIAAFGLVGALLLYRRPGHRLGWLLTGIGILALLGGSANEYVLAGTRAGHPASDFVAWLVWLSNWFWWPVVGGVFVFLPLLFPDGRPPTPRWRWVLIIGLLAILGLVLASALQQRYTATILGEIPSIESPLGIGVLTNEESVLNEIPAWILLAAFVGAVASMTVRFRRSDGVERLQLKWFSYAVGLMLAWTLLGEVLWESVLGHDDLLGGSVFPFGLLLTLIPITIAIAILRYRLYAIDRIVSRSVSYGLLVGLLAFLYAGGVFVARSIFPAAQTDLAVAASTLGVAVLFTPLRQRIQRAVDRRFNRSRYNAERVIEEFASGLQNQVQLEEVSSGLRLVLDRTIQPLTTEIWLRSQS